MERCLSCDAHFVSSKHECPECGRCVPIANGFPAYAPELEKNASGFKPEYFSRLAEKEAGNFWFTSRNRLIVWAIGKYCNQLKSFLEVGCGTGFVLSGIANCFPESELHGSELFSTGLSFASSRIPTANFSQMDARCIPYVDEFDAIGAFDVLEHIEEDESVLSQLHAALVSQGVLILTVPQHPWLWSIVDERACHVRRYTAEELHRKVEKAGFQILHSTSFVTVLLPAMALSRLAKRRTVRDSGAEAELEISPVLNALFTILLRAERLLISAGVKLPIGGSRLLVARKLPVS